MKHPPTLILMRPRMSALNDMQICQQAGWHPVLMEYQHFKPVLSALSQLQYQSLQTDVILWNSPGAVHQAANYVPKNLSCQHVAIGEGTAVALAQSGFRHIIYPEDGQDSEAVARLPLWQARQGKVLLIKGCGGRDWLQGNLHLHGWNTEVAEVYERVPQLLDWSLLYQQKNIQAIYLTTVAAVNAWFNQLPVELHALSKSLLYLVHHPRIVNVLCEYGVSTMLVPNLRLGLANLHSCSSE
ncbi:uroporphyrinogen-III synthase [Snodgrassella sp. B3882]|uniref:uroporphyrinogen-III synthase n=1 Tax=Snodgrassella sp. B3882 TaxID=2818037 RepID=UPI00226AE64F|nr:uroporphyrinogen-III synthase [Snodgrassella sp. B3882]MCX8744516.1 uroporphyrinogen-III synthase [Snodgrassella sp. B3882]